MKNRSSKRRANQGVENLIGFIVAVGVFTVALIVILASVRNSVPPNTGITDLKSKASQALTVLSTTPGVPENWHLNPDYGPTQIERLGLAQSSTSSTLSGDKFIAMTGCALSANPTNRKLDYAEAKLALGLSGYDFHVRTYPVFEGSTTGYGTVAISDMKVAYIGNYGSLTNPPSVLWDVSETSESTEESTAVSLLGAQFTNTLYIPPLTQLWPLPPILERQGDKFADKSDYIQNNLVPRLTSNYYHILVVGSNTDQTALTPSAVKNAITNWVRAGGRLIVLGGQQNANWLEPFLTTGTRGASGGIYVPDTGHPILNVPNKLSYSSYTDPGRTWIVPDETYSHVITKGPAPGQKDKMEDVLAISNDGAVDSKGDTIFGNGTIILTTYLPYVISSQLGQKEEAMFLANMFMYVAHRTAFLDYGPSIPSGVAIGTSEKLSLASFAKFGSLEVHFIFYVWKGT
ncbi:MAG: hypothetical protein PHH26_06130 [Candidatus Thermoplasmatota archaeon]|nr:hypothetical protein [Candidatus Thermoplasmatota archaeon]